MKKILGLISVLLIGALVALFVMGDFESQDYKYVNELVGMGEDHHIVRYDIDNPENSERYYVVLPADERLLAIVAKAHDVKFLDADVKDAVVSGRDDFYADVDIVINVIPNESLENMGEEGKAKAAKSCNYRVAYIPDLVDTDESFYAVELCEK